MAQLFQSGSNGFVNPTSSVVSTGCKTPNIGANRSAALRIPNAAPILLPPTAPGFFLYPAGANGELHALPVAPINPTANSLPAGPPLGMLNTPLCPLPRPPLLNPQPLAPSGDGISAPGDGFEKSIELTPSQASKGKNPTSSGFFPAHYDALNITNPGRVCYSFYSFMSST